MPNLTVPILVAIALLALFHRRLVEDWKFFRRNRNEWLLDKWENWGKPLLIAAILAFGIRTFILGPYKIPTGSMRTTLMERDRIFVEKVSYRFHEPKRGDIVVFKYPLDRKKDFVKRLVAFGGETVEIRDGQIYIDGKRLETPPSFAGRFYYNRNDWPYGKEGQVFKVPDGHFFALGDNSAHSSDSRNWGFVPRKDLVGRAVVVWWPPERVRLLKNQ